MASVNKVMLVGRLGRAPELKEAAGKRPLAKMRLATNRRWKDRDSGEPRESTEWHSIVTFGRQAENCAKYLDKGSLVFVEGRLNTRSWEGRDGNTRYTTEVQARTVQFLDWRDNGKGSSTAAGSPPIIADDDVPF